MLVRIPPGFDAVMRDYYAGDGPPEVTAAWQRAYIVALVAASLANLDYVDMAEAIMRINREPLVH